MIDGPSSLITEQVEAGLYVRMAVLYELLAGRERPAAACAAPTRSSRRRRRSGSPREGDLLARLARRRRASAATLVVRGARVLDPASGLDATRDVVVRGGEIAELAPPARGELPRAPR